MGLSVRSHYTKRFIPCQNGTWDFVQVKQTLYQLSSILNLGQVSSFIFDLRSLSVCECDGDIIRDSYNLLVISETYRELFK